MNQSKIISIENLAGGLVTMGSPLINKNQPETQSPDCLNVYGIWTVVRRRSGFAKLNASTYTEQGNGIYNYKYDQDTQYLVALCGTGLKKMDISGGAWDGTWDAITVDPNLGTTLSDDIAHFANWEGICIISTDSQDIPQRYFPGINSVTKSAYHRDLDWEISHAVVTGDVTTYTATSGDKLKITFDGDTDANLKLLLEGEGVDGASTITDGSPDTRTPTNSGVTTEEDQKKFGSASLYFTNGGTDNFYYANSTDFDFVDGWTLSFFLRLDAHTGTEYIAWKTESSTEQGFFIYHTHGARLAVNFRNSSDSGVEDLVAPEITDTDFHHVLLVKIGNRYALYFDGNQVANHTNTTDFNNTGNLIFGCSTNSMYGYLDSVRLFTDNPFGAAPNAGNTDTITVPTAAYSGDYVFDDIVMTGDGSIDDAVASINAETGISNYGIAYKDDSGYLAIASYTRGTGSTVLVEDGGTGNAGEAEDLFDAGAAVTDTGLAGCPSAKYYIVWKDHVWAYNITGFPDRLQRSANDSYIDWAGTDSGSKDIRTERDVGGTGLAVLDGRLYAFKKWSIHRVSYLGGSPLLEYRQVTEIGTDSPRTIKLVDVPGEGLRLFFLGTDRQLYKFDGYNLTPVSEAIREYNGDTNYSMIGDDTTYGVNSAELNACHMTVDTAKHHLKLYFCLGADTTPDTAFVYDYLMKTWWPMNYGVAFRSSCNADNGAGKIVEYTMGTGFAYLMDSGNADVAAAITAHWVSRKIGKSPSMFKLDGINVVSKSIACTPTVHYRDDWDTDWLEPSDSATLVTATNDHNLGLPTIPNLIQVRLSDSSTDAAFEFYEFHLLGEKLGQGK